MDLDKLIQFIESRSHLPAISAHEKMAPPSRPISGFSEIKNKNPKQAGVMVLLIPNNTTITIPLIERNTYPGVHSGQISFPGGKLENTDTNLSYTAVRETEEEIGIPSSEVTLIRELSGVYIPPSHFWVQPFIGFTREYHPFIREEKEVKDIFEISIQDIIEMPIQTLTVESYTVPAFTYKDKIIWGATAMMLNEFRELMKMYNFAS